MGPNKGELVIHDGNWQHHVAPVINGERVSRGLIPRDFHHHPYASGNGYDAVDIPLIPRSEWSARLKEMVETKSLLSDIRMVGNNGQMIPSLDQNGQGFCWAYSTGSSILINRARDNQPYVRVSPHAVACKIKGFQDEGGWGALSMEFAVKNGYPSDKFWPQQSMSRSYDKPETWENAKLHRVMEGYWDLSATVYDRNLTFDQVATCLLNRIPVCVDMNWWSHAICAVDLVEIESGSFGLRIWNSWGDSWSDKGMGILQGNRAIPDGATAARVVIASVI